LRKFKRFHRNVDDFVPATVCHVDFELQLGLSIAQVTGCFGVGRGIDLLKEKVVVDIVIVWGTIIWMMTAVWKHYKWVAVAQVPYFVWVSIATVLQLAITFWNWGR
jgi:hypothetical protein